MKLPPLGRLRKWIRDRRHYARHLYDREALQHILPALLRQEIPVISFRLRGAADRLEEVYMNMTEGESSP